MKKGFLESSGEALYPPEGSHQGEVSDEVIRAGELPEQEHTDPVTRHNLLSD